ncbi:MAG: 1-acyl-sn-glycerol-3-phosphate acyltransferase [Treponema sp.]|nr:1-acyl-sn-glycerol-3-phosphate acyltransferase [Treponema sp.]
MKKKVDPRYSTEGLPPVKSMPLYIYGCIAKLLMCVIFGTGAILIGIIVLPVFKLIFHPNKNFKKQTRKFFSYIFRFFVFMMELTQCLKLKVSNKEDFRKLSSTIIVANHPSILDVVFLISLMPNADCIVRGGLSRSIFAIIIKQLYLVNTLGIDEMYALAKETLAEGNNLIIFPEGTRTPRHGVNKFKRGAAHIAYETDTDIQPVYIGGTDKYGLGKHDAFFSFNRTDIYVYDIKLLPPIHINEYKEYEPQIATRHLTKKIHSEIAAEAYLYDNRII